LQEFHGGIIGGNFFFNIIKRKILDADYWWPTMNCDVHEYYQTYDQCQKTNNMLTHNVAKLVITLPREPFQKWGLDFIGFVKPTNRLSGNRYILQQSGWKHEHSTPTLLLTCPQTLEETQRWVPKQNIERKIKLGHAP
jgi:predicted deacetylase